LDSGVWFDINRTGMNFDTEYSVKKHQVMIRDPKTGIPSYTDDRSPIPESIAADYRSAGYDLTTIYQKKNYNELREILTANIHILSQSNSDLYIEEFALVKRGAAPTAVGSVLADNSEPVKSAVPRGSGNVNLKLDDPGIDYLDDEDTVIASTVSETSTEDLMQMAEDIFNS
jgi:hypothetical protein